MNCRKTLELLADLVDGALAPDVEAALRAHLDGCPACVRFLDGYRGTSRILRDATDVTLPPDVEARLLDFLARRS